MPEEEVPDGFRREERLPVLTLMPDWLVLVEFIAPHPPLSGYPYCIPLLFVPPYVLAEFECANDGCCSSAGLTGCNPGCAE